MGTELGGYGVAHAVEFEFWSGWSDGMPVRARTRLFYQERDDQNRLEKKWPGTRRGVDLEAAIRPASAWEIRGNLVYSRVSGGTESRALIEISIFDVLGFPGF